MDKRSGRGQPREATRPPQKVRISRVFALLLVVPTLVIVFVHFALFQVQQPQELGIVITDIAILAVITLTLFETHRLTRVWRGPFTWLNAGIVLFFIGFLLDLLSDFFIEPTFLTYVGANGAKLVAFGVLAWGFVQWGKERIETKQSLERLKQVDSLTGLPGRSGFHQTLARLERIAERYQEPFSLISVDIPHFKDYVYERSAADGDELLKRIAGLLHRQVREGDLVFRYDDHHFMVLAPLGGVTRAREITQSIAQRLGRALGDASTPGAPEIMVAFSFYQEGKSALQELETRRMKAEAMGRDGALHIE